MKTLTQYIVGFALSIVLTLAAFGLVYSHEMSGHTFPSHPVAMTILVLLAVAQLFVQAILFLHVGKEEKPRWNLLALGFAILIVTILVGGSLWIMNHLNHNQMSASDVFEDENILPPN